MYEFSLRIAGCALLILISGACARENPAPQNAAMPVSGFSVSPPDMPDEILASLEHLAELERAGNFFPGLGLTESGLREQAGDFSGAAIAAFKELSWAYGHGSVPRSQVEEGLANALGLLAEVPAAGSGIIALRGCIAFAREEWEQALGFLSEIPAEEEPDSFLRWMLLVCGFEGQALNDGRPDRSAYSSIRARYSLFPEYWYRGARAFAGDGNIRAVYAEQCINVSPQGPFAAECRKIIFDHTGLSFFSRDTHEITPNDAHLAIRTRAEIETIVRASVSANNPGLLEELFPLMALPDNPYTIYAQGTLKALSANPAYRSFFTVGAHDSSGRLRERLNYISRG
jgi:hypothetical protein